MPSQAPSRRTSCGAALSRLRRAALSFAATAIAAASIAITPQTSHAQTGACAGVLATPPVGQVCGTTDTVTVLTQRYTLNVFRGIPYAKAPVGARRWQPPADSSWTGVLPATTFGSKCMQDSAKVAVGSESCLYLNVWMPPGATASSRLPVMVFIHGGAFVIGSGSSGLYDGSYLATRGNVVVVTMNYRLGAFGFLSTDSVPGMAMRGNQGLLDQQKALRWVQAGISAFGGDPAKVTLFGESAGAMSVGFHLFAIPGSVPLFRAAIMESNPMGVEYRDTTRAKGDGAHFIRDLCNSARRFVDCHNANWLQSVPATTILTAARSYSGTLAAIERLRGGGLTEGLPWTPVIDSVLVWGQPYRGYVRGMTAKPYVFGMNQDEGVIFAADAQTASKGLFPPWLYNDALKAVFDPAGSRSDSTNQQRIVNYKVRGVADSLPYRATGHPPVAGLNATPSALAELIVDFAFNCGNLSAANLADTATAAGVNNANAGQAIYAYGFEQHPFFDLYAGDKACAAGPTGDNVCHAFELPYVFHTLAYATNVTRLNGSTPLPQTHADSLVSDSMVVAWARFATNPSAAPTPAWSAYTPGGSLYTWGGANNGQMQSGLASAAACSALWYTLPPLNGTSAKPPATAVRRPPAPPQP